MELLKAAILGVVEGLTEFIPISSTGHLIIASRLLGLEGPRWDTFCVVIQFGAILSVFSIYRDRFFRLLRFENSSGFAGLNGIFLLGVATVPALAIGALAHDAIKAKLFNPITVAIGLGIGGLAMVALDLWPRRALKQSLDEIHWKDALAIGLFQCLAMWPGTSRAAATIIGGLLIGLDRKTSAEFSFLVAVPVICAASFYDLFKSLSFLHASDAPLFLVGLVVSFVAAWFSIRFFVQYISRHGLTLFGIYRLLIAPAVYLLF